MQPLPTKPDSYFEKYPITPVNIKPFNPKSLIIAESYINRLDEVLSGTDAKIELRGSTAFRIAGKGEVEIGVYTNSQNWLEVIKRIKILLGTEGEIENDRAEFVDKREGFEVEVTVMKNSLAEIDRALNGYVASHEDIAKEYEFIKKKYSFSRRDYERQKDKFLRGVIENMAES